MLIVNYQIKFIERIELALPKVIFKKQLPTMGSNIGNCFFNINRGVEKLEKKSNFVAFV
jgi:hypothetical protein